MSDPILIARHGDIACSILPGLANRHGLITGATGTGKTVTLQKLAESFSQIGVPVFLSDVKGDLTGISQPGNLSPKLAATLQERGLALPTPQACPTQLWDVFGEQGHPVRATISDMGPLLLARMLNLNDTQAGVLNLVFKIADDNGLLLLDLKDLRTMLAYVGENAKEFTTSYGNISAASLGIVTPFCSCSAVPLFIGFLTAGVPLGVTFSFLIAAPMINEVALALLFGLFGWKVAVLYLVMGLLVAIVAGFVIGKLKMERYLEDWVQKIQAGQGVAHADQAMAWVERFDAGWSHVKQIVGKVWPYILLGIGLGVGLFILLALVPVGIV